jgi:hypothetical protein
MTNLTPTPIQLSEKAQEFIKAVGDYSNINGKVRLLGAETFENIFPYLLTPEMQKTLEMPNPSTEPNATIAVQLDFASLIEMDIAYMETLYQEYLKSFMR